MQYYFLFIILAGLGEYSFISFQLNYPILPTAQGKMTTGCALRPSKSTVSQTLAWTHLFSPCVTLLYHEAMMMLIQVSR